VSLTIKLNETADVEADVDIARFTTDRESLHIEFARIISTNTDSGEIEELEICSTHKMPIANAIETLLSLLGVLVDHEQEFKTGYGIILPDSEEPD